MKKNIIDIIALVLVVVGGLNWGLVALDFNLVTYIFGIGTILTKIVYILVALSAVYVAVKIPRMTN